MSLSKQFVFVWWAIFFVFGVFAASVFYVEIFWVYVAMAVSVFCACLFYYFRQYKSAAFVAAVFFLFFGIWRLEISIKPNEFAEDFGKKIVVQGMVAEEPDVRESRQQITFLPDNASQKILLILPKTRELEYGDILEVSGKLIEPEAFSDFDYPGFLRRYNIYGKMSYPEVKVQGSGGGGKAKYWLLKIKKISAQRIGEYLKEPEKSLVLGILIGLRQAMPAGVMEDFRLSGLSHIVAVSGFNISIMLSAAASLSWIIGRRRTFWFMVFLVAVFTVMAGATASAVRAAIMGIVVAVSLSFGKMYKAGPGLLVAASVMLLVNPLVLYWDAGFQLSFLATLGIVYGVPILEKYKPERGILKDILGAAYPSLCAILFTLPLSLGIFGTLALAALPANIFIAVVPAVQAVMAFGVLILMPLAGAGFAFLASIPAKYILFVADFFANLSLDMKLALPKIYIFPLYLILFFVFYFLDKKKKNAEKVEKKINFV